MIDIPEIDDEALGMAGMAFIHSPGPTDNKRVRDAVTAYLFTTRQAVEDDGWRIYPSWERVRAAVEAARAQHAIERENHA